MAQDCKHIVYAVVKHGTNGRRRVRVSDKLDWHAAISRWYKLDDRRRAGLPMSAEGPILYFAVRAEDDPAWPVSGRRVTVRACTRKARAARRAVRALEAKI